MTGPAYAAARLAAFRIQPHFDCVLPMDLRHNGELPNVSEAETIIDAAFWASLRREEGRSPQISLAFLPPGSAGHVLRFERPLPLSPPYLVRLAPAVEGPGIHLGVWRGDGELFVWGATRTIPAFCFVLEAISPGLLVVKHRRGDGSAKFINVAVLEGDRVKVLDQDVGSRPECPDLISTLIGRHAAWGEEGSINPLVDLAVSMRAQGHGGILLVAPAETESWRESILHPIRYSVAPPFSRLAERMAENPGRNADPGWHEDYRRAIEVIGGLTSVDGATVMNSRYEVLAFGAKIGRREGCVPVERVIVTEPVEGAAAHTVAASRTGGTRHLSAAQFAHDQRDAYALVASQDGRFTIFEWSRCEETVHAHRIEALLL